MTVRAKNIAGNVSAASTALPVTTSAASTLRDPENPTSTVAGLDYKYYQGSWSVLPNFDVMTPVKTGTVANFDMSVRNRTDNYGFKYSGFINITTAGQYTFYTSSDDGSTEVVNNDGLHGMVEKSGTIGLKAGKHAIAVTFFEAGGGEGLIVSYAGPGIAKQAIPNAALSRTSTNSVVNLIQNFGFEEASLSPGTNYGTSSHSLTNARSGSKCTSLSAGGGVEQVVTGLSPSTTYTLKAWAKVTTARQAVYIGVKDFGGTDTSRNVTSSNYTQISFTFTTGAANTSAKIYLWTPSTTTNPTYGDDFELTIGSSTACVANVEEADLLEVTAYPNPVADGVLKLNVQSYKEQMAQVFLSNTLSQTVVRQAVKLQTGNNQVSVSVDKLPKGIYFATIVRGQSRVTKKLIIE